MWCENSKESKTFRIISSVLLIGANMLRILTNNIRCARSLPVLLETNCWRNCIGSFVGAQQRWKSDEARSYKAAILEEFDKKLTVESIKNRTKLGDGMVSTAILLHGCDSRNWRWLLVFVTFFAGSGRCQLLQLEFGWCAIHGAKERWNHITNDTRQWILGWNSWNRRQLQTGFQTRR